MTKKANPLLTALLDEPIRKSGTTWAERMQASDPQKYQWIVELCMDYHNGGEAFRKLQTMSGVFHFLQKHDMLPPMARSTFRDWFIKTKA